MVGGSKRWGSVVCLRNSAFNSMPQIAGAGGREQPLPHQSLVHPPSPMAAQRQMEAAQRQGPPVVPPAAQAWVLRCRPTRSCVLRWPPAE